MVKTLATCDSDNWKSWVKVTIPCGRQSKKRGNASLHLGNQKASTRRVGNLLYTASFGDPLGYVPKWSNPEMLAFASGSCSTKLETNTHTQTLTYFHAHTQTHHVWGLTLRSALLLDPKPPDDHNASNSRRKMSSLISDLLLANGGCADGSERTSGAPICIRMCIYIHI